MERLIEIRGKKYRPCFYQNPNNDPCIDCDLSDNDGNCTCGDLCDTFDEDEFGITNFKQIKN